MDRRALFMTIPCLGVAPAARGAQTERMHARAVRLIAIVLGLVTAACSPQSSGHANALPATASGATRSTLAQTAYRLVKTVDLRTTFGYGSAAFPNIESMGNLVADRVLPAVYFTYSYGDGQESHVFTDVRAVSASDTPAAVPSIPTYASASQVAIGPRDSVWVTWSDFFSLDFPDAPVYGVNFAGAAGSGSVQVQDEYAQMLFGADNGDEYFSDGSTIGLDSVVTQHALPAGVAFSSYAPDSNGGVWATDNVGHRIVRLVNGKIASSYAIAGRDALSMVTLGPSGDVWFTAGTATIGRLAVASGTSMLTAAPNVTLVESLAVGKDDAAYFIGTDNANHTSIGTVLPQGTASATLAGDPIPQSIVSTADGSLWVGRMMIEPSGICDCEVDQFRS